MKDNIDKLLNSRGMRGEEVLQNPIDLSMNTAKNFAKQMLEYAKNYFGLEYVEIALNDFKMLDRLT